MHTQLVTITRTTACSDCWKLWAPNYRLQGCTSCRLATQPSAKPTSGTYDPTHSSTRSM
jgi:hypothetical protein